MNTKRKPLSGSPSRSARRGNGTSRRISLCAALLAFLLCGSAVSAQTVSIADRLPASTVFYIHWRGKAFLADAE